MLKNYNVKLGLSCLVILMASGVAHASTSTVSGASVTKGQSSVEARMSYSANDEGGSNDDRVRTRVHYDIGVTDFYAFRAVVAGDKRKGDNHEFDSLTIENRFQLLNKKRDGWDLGVRLNYTQKDGDKSPNEMRVHVIQEVPYGDWTLRLNEIFDHEVGEDSSGGFFVETRMQLTYKFENGQRFGLESFNNFGRINDLNGFDNQSHTLGSVAKGSFFNTGLGYETAWRVGVSDAAADHAVLFALSKKF